MSFEPARAVADAVLLEGYVLYPYRASAPKNQFRWAFGVLAPRSWSEAGGCEPCWMQTQVLVEGSRQTRLEGRLRFLRVVRRTVEALTEDAWREVERLEVGERLLLPWEEGEVREVDFTCALGEDRVVPFALEGDEQVEHVGEGRLVRRKAPLQGRLRIGWELVAEGVWRLTVRADNETPVDDVRAPRDVALRSAAIGAHLLLAVTGGDFVSQLDPPDALAEAAAACRQERGWPVLAGPRGRRDLVLAAPIILYDHPQVAPESPGDLFDASEIDELLTLRTATLTPEEKRQARATDPRAAAILDRVDHLPPEVMGRLHGALRDLADQEMVPREGPVHDPQAAAAAGVEVGCKVRLRPGSRRTDAQDLLYAGMVATVRAVLWDVEGEPHMAVTLDEDPAAELHHWYGRFHYYRPDEVERLEGGEAT